MPDGYINAIPASGTAWGTTHFDLIHSPTDADRFAGRYPGHCVHLQHR